MTDRSGGQAGKRPAGNSPPLSSRSGYADRVRGIRLGLCCIFREAPIKFRVVRAVTLVRMTRSEAKRKLAETVLANAGSLRQAIVYCHENGIGAFRVTSPILPLATHPEHTYGLQDLNDGGEAARVFEECGRLGERYQIRLSFHADQFVVLNSPRPEVVESSVRELAYQAEVAEVIGADTINLHLGGGYGDKEAAMARFAEALERLPAEVRRRLTLENDDRVYSAAEVLRFCEENGAPMVYDVHHHRLLPDGLSIGEATERAMATWDREPLFHLSSPLDGWDGKTPQRHHDFVDLRDFPREWLDRELTVEVEAKAKEVAVLRLREELGGL